jgi:hypothetical protein
MPLSTPHCRAHRDNTLHAYVSFFSHRHLSVCSSVAQPSSSVKQFECVGGAFAVCGKVCYNLCERLTVAEGEGHRSLRERGARREREERRGMQARTGETGAWERQGSGKTYHPRMRATGHPRQEGRSEGRVHYPSTMAYRHSRNPALPSDLPHSSIPVQGWDHHAAV